MNEYSFYAYDHHGRLKMSAGMWLCLLYLLHPYLIIVMSIANIRDRMGLINLVYPEQWWLALSAVAALPAIAFFIAWVKWQKQQEGIFLTLWRNGKLVLLLSSCLYLTLFSLSWYTYYGSFSLVLQTVFAIILVIYLLLSQRVKDVLNQPMQALDP